MGGKVSWPRPLLASLQMAPPCFFLPLLGPREEKRHLGAMSWRCFRAFDRVGGRQEGSPSPPNKCSSREAGTGAKPREGWGAAVGAGVEVEDRRWCISTPKLGLSAHSELRTDDSMANTLPLLSARGREGGCTQDATPGDVPAERKGAHTYCSRPPSLGSGRKEREEVTGAALGATHVPP